MAVQIKTKDYLTTISVDLEGQEVTLIGAEDKEGFIILDIKCENLYQLVDNLNHLKGVDFWELLEKKAEEKRNLPPSPN